MNMAISRPSDRDFYSTMRDLKWSSTAKAIARRCFDRALRQELDAAIQSTKETAAKIRQASELWELEHHLTQLSIEISTGRLNTSTPRSYLSSQILFGKANW